MKRLTAKEAKEIARQAATPHGKELDIILRDVELESKKGCLDTVFLTANLANLNEAGKYNLRAELTSLGFDVSEGNNGHGVSRWIIRWGLLREGRSRD